MLCLQLVDSAGPPAGDLQVTLLQYLCRSVIKDMVPHASQMHKLATKGTAQHSLWCYMHGQVSHDTQRDGHAWAFHMGTGLLPEPGSLSSLPPCPPRHAGGWQAGSRTPASSSTSVHAAWSPAPGCPGSAAAAPASINHHHQVTSPGGACTWLLAYHETFMTEPVAGCSCRLRPEGFPAACTSMCRHATGLGHVWPNTVHAVVA